MKIFALTTLSFWYFFLFILLFALLICAGWKACKKKKKDIDNCPDEDFPKPKKYYPMVFGKKEGGK